jgi:hypothetical protein
MGLIGEIEALLAAGATGVALDRAYDALGSRFMRERGRVAASRRQSLVKDPRVAQKLIEFYRSSAGIREHD